ncbi:kinesin-associated protein-domain-containing protein [Chytridium lagenaria]|nr:kinesin-associated protein-domain-containing protein [Chytridium lagenaria]
MDDQDYYQLKKKITPGSIDAHPTENAIIVNYFVQATMVDENGFPVSSDRKAMQKITNLSNLAHEVVEKCKLIHPSRERDVEQVLYYLQQRNLTDDSHGTFCRKKNTSNRAWLRKQVDEARQQQQDDETINNSTKDESSSLDRIEHYIEGLYEEIPDKIASTRKILYLAKMPENMEALISNEALISALSRVLREDNKKSMELVTNIIYIFFCFSNYSRFHQVTDQELHRFNIWVQDIEKLEIKCRHAQRLTGDTDVCFHLLMNLAEDLNIEVKMIKRDIVKYLMIMLERKTPELLILSTTFLKKLSVFKENKDEMVKGREELIRKLDAILPSENQALQTLVLRLLLNLSHDAKFRAGLVRFGFLDKAVELLHSKVHTSLVLQLLYQMSLDDAIGQRLQVIKLILESKGERVNVELMALAINISTDSKCAAIICEDKGLKFLARRALKTRDTLILKMLRNLSSHEGDNKLYFCSPKLTRLLHLSRLGFCGDSRGGSVKGTRSHAGLTDDDDVTLELIILLGTMSNDENIPTMVSRSNIIYLLMELMLGLFIRGSCLTILAKEEDDEMVLQILRNISVFVVSYLIDLLYDRNTQIRKMCDVCLDIIAEIDEDWVKNIKQQKFQWHNAEYLAVVAQATDLHGHDDDFDDHEEYQPEASAPGRYKSEWQSQSQLVTEEESDDEEMFTNRVIGGTNALLEGP